MGVAGSGKTTVGKLLADTLGWNFRDADEFHPAANIEKMRAGVSLKDSDRAPWLQAMRSAIENWLASNTNAVLTCSCLKAIHREQLLIDRQRLRLVYLKGDLQVIATRLNNRPQHFFKKDLLSSQFETLEEPEDAITVPVTDSPEHIVDTIRSALHV